MLEAVAAAAALYTSAIRVAEVLRRMKTGGKWKKTMKHALPDSHLLTNELTESSVDIGALMEVKEFGDSVGVVVLAYRVE